MVKLFLEPTECTGKIAGSVQYAASNRKKLLQVVGIIVLLFYHKQSMGHLSSWFCIENSIDANMGTDTQTHKNKSKNQALIIWRV